VDQAQKGDDNRQEKHQPRKPGPDGYTDQQVVGRPDGFLRPETGRHPFVVLADKGVIVVGLHTEADAHHRMVLGHFVEVVPHADTGILLEPVRHGGKVDHGVKDAGNEDDSRHKDEEFFPIRCKKDKQADNDGDQSPL
jgi:hypothetical protein